MRQLSNGMKAYLAAQVIWLVLGLLATVDALRLEHLDKAAAPLLVCLISSIMAEVARRGLKLYLS